MKKTLLNVKIFFKPLPILCLLLFLTLFFTVHCNCDPTVTPQSSSENSNSSSSKNNSSSSSSSSVSSSSSSEKALTVTNDYLIGKLLLENTNANPTAAINLAEIAFYTNPNQSGKNFALQTNNTVLSGLILTSYPNTNIINGNITDFYHSEGEYETNNWLTITFDPPIVVRSTQTFHVLLHNRDDCCWERSLGIRLHFFDTNDQWLMGTPFSISESEKTNRIFEWDFDISILDKKSPPTVVSTSPQNEESDIGFSPTLTFTFDRTIELNNPPIVLLMNNIGADSFSLDDNRRTFDEITKTIEISLVTNFLAPDQTYTLILSNDSVVDIVGRGNSEHSLVFTTASPIGINRVLFASTNRLGENQSADDGSFSNSISLSLSTGIDIKEEFSNIFNTNLMNRLTDGTIPLTIVNLPSGLVVNLSKEENSAGKVTNIRINLPGNAENHTKRVDNIDFTLTFSSSIFEVARGYQSADIPLDTELIFGSKHWSGRNRS